MSRRTITYSTFTQACPNGTVWNRVMGGRASRQSIIVANQNGAAISISDHDPGAGNVGYIVFDPRVTPFLNRRDFGSLITSEVWVASVNSVDTVLITEFYYVR